MIKICVMTCDMNSTLGSIVPLAMFLTYTWLCKLFFFSPSFPGKSPRLTSNFFRTVTNNYNYDQYFSFFVCIFFFYWKYFPLRFISPSTTFPGSSPKFSGSPKFSQDTITCNSDGLKNGHVDQYIKGGLKNILTVQI